MGAGAAEQKKGHAEMPVLFGVCGLCWSWTIFNYKGILFSSKERYKTKKEKTMAENLFSYTYLVGKFSVDLKPETWIVMNGKMMG